MLSVVILRVVMLRVVMLSVVMLSFVMLSIIMLSAIMLNVVALLIRAAACGLLTCCVYLKGQSTEFSLQSHYFCSGHWHNYILVVWASITKMLQSSMTPLELSVSDTTI